MHEVNIYCLIFASGEKIPIILRVSRVNKEGCSKAGQHVKSTVRDEM